MCNVVVLCSIIESTFSRKKIESLLHILKIKKNLKKFKKIKKNE